MTILQYRYLKTKIFIIYNFKLYKIIFVENVERTLPKNNYETHAML